MAIFDPNLIAARVLREALVRHRRFDQLWRQDFFRKWREAGAALRRQPKPKKLLGPRVLHKKLSSERLAAVGNLDGLLP